MPNLVELIKQAAVEANEAGDPTCIIFGTVETIEPLVVVTEQKLSITADFLMLTRQVMDRTVEMTVDHVTEFESGGSGESSFSSHSHAYKGKKSFLVHNALKIGDKVILLKQQGGQLYIILDKIMEGGAT